MNQTISEKMTVDYLFVVDNSEPKYSIYERSIDMIDFIKIKFLKRVYKNFTINHLFIIKLEKTHVFKIFNDIGLRELSKTRNE